ncbi:hypothetical protein [Methyloradius palustris]|uniref:Uncharacterized protein n=1 Tax=Methyloradius palustris TaxID=2778876 RepID=A0A8D5G5S5_9PROT|nr:hypothetical protein [Methyloradius palustris]BCM23841.1 hypothetical protein ZMTM_01000 [Methyloradius palustris]
MDNFVIRLLMLAGLMISITAHASDSFGRLFTTPAERTNLNYMRQTARLQSQEQADGIEKVAPPVIPSEISMQGYVKRSDGKKGTVWINNQPMQENTSNSEVTVGKMHGDNNQVPLTLPANGKNLSLKAGQIYKPETDSVSEVSAHSSSEKELKGTIGNSELPMTNQLNQADSNQK